VPTVREAMVVAGGAGTRLLPLTRTTPKPLLPFCDAPFLEGVARRLAAVGVERLLLVVGADTAPFDRFAADATRLGLEVATVPEPEPLDTAGGVRSALDLVSGTFLVLNGDILTDVDVAAAVQAHGRAGAQATLVLTRVEDTSSFGVCVREGTRIVDFVEKPAPGSLPGQDAINAGTYVLEPAALERFPAGRLSFERDVFPGLVDAGAHVEGYLSDAVWADLGTPDRYLEGHRLALDGALAWPTLQDVGAEDGGIRVAPQAEVADGAQLRGPVLVGRGARVAADAVVGPHAVVGAGASVGAGAQVRDSVLHPRATLETDVQVAGAVVGAGATLGAGVRAGPDVVVGAGETVEAGRRLHAGTRLPPA
jgi:mannose-1-phosphate guanylyltransferase